MNSCSNDHPIIYHDLRSCPLCDMREELRDELAALRNTFDQFGTRISELDEEFYNLAQQNSRFRAILSDIAPERLL